MRFESGAAIKKGRRQSKKDVKAAIDVQYVPRTSKKAVDCQKRLSAVKKGPESCLGRLVRAVDIKKGCRLTKKAKKATKASGDISSLFFLTRNADAGNPTIFFRECEEPASLHCVVLHQTSCAVNRSSYSMLFLLQNFMNINGTTLFLFFLSPRVSPGPQKPQILTA